MIESLFPENDREGKKFELDSKLLQTLPKVKGI